MKTVYLEITEDGLTFRNELGEARLIMVGESVTLENIQGAKIRIELLGDYRARSPSTSDAARCLFDQHRWVEQPAGGPIETAFSYCSTCGALGDAGASEAHKRDAGPPP